MVIRDQYPQGTTFLYAAPSPDSGTDNQWTIGKLSSGEKGKIILTLKMPDAMNETFTSQDRAVGTGFINVYKKLSTSNEPISLKNTATLACAELQEISTSATVELSDLAGTQVAETEHGSGVYSREGTTKLESRNKSIGINKRLSVIYGAISSTLPGKRLLLYKSKWSDAQVAKNFRTGSSLNERYIYAAEIRKDSSLELDENGSTLANDVEFQGSGHLGALKRSYPTQVPSRLRPSKAEKIIRAGST